MQSIQGYLQGASFYSKKNNTPTRPKVGFWDPLGLSADGDIDTFKRRRAVELKHGPLDKQMTFHVDMFAIPVSGCH